MDGVTVEQHQQLSSMQQNRIKSSIDTINRKYLNEGNLMVTVRQNKKRNKYVIKYIENFKNLLSGALRASEVKSN